VRFVHMLCERFVPKRFRGIVTEMAKFGAVGLVNTVLDYAVLNLLLSAGPLKAKVASTVVATTASYLMNRHWTFNTRDRAGLRREYTLFFALNLVGLVIQLTVLGAAKYGLGFTEHGGGDDRLALNLFNALGIGVAMVFRFWAYRTFVFTHTPERVGGTDDLDAELATAEPAAVAVEPGAVAIERTVGEPTVGEPTASELAASRA
jgi:putative flippase GtrA